MQRRRCPDAGPWWSGLRLKNRLAPSISVLSNQDVQTAYSNRRSHEPRASVASERRLKPSAGDYLRGAAARPMKMPTHQANCAGEHGTHESRLSISHRRHATCLRCGQADLRALEVFNLLLQLHILLANPISGYGHVLLLLCRCHGGYPTRPNENALCRLCTSYLEIRRLDAPCRRGDRSKGRAKLIEELPPPSPAARRISCGSPCLRDGAEAPLGS